ncbi:taurine dioxygenase [Cylindrospermopsis raciborskii S07]|uniref:Alpha-ketoglutarate-dependent sulfate ester dioxygenase n=1 Tax=Cylindrospermopsis raciborskii CS-505 TaxID=533240 RepID=A0A853M7D4_9CYAN|nr:TauD/TfdA family dioxygenase [Cylindrospermopsis raciborskii]EFA69033.1 Taurine catabolism dioxygenase TauD/TfdA [Cylindrospermopsis raciborskii CS-505]OBU74981.1 taurine dioxygenase [Cylindrospermopsis raciborskii CS-505]PNK07298.1 taurine dioxygenase [Cylindrospermopsis raciborskii S10]PNK10227.1 taurine dioxygenase [Cylindrospermopsis raciborskii S07]PNK11884.1 taurine dioxygenase [Cylindrospermopsis raciborskii S14]
MTYQHLKIKPIAGRIGAKILEIDLKQNLQDEVINEIRRALVQYKVIFFREQNLTAQEQIAFARRFGQITTAHPTVPSLVGSPEILDLDYGRTAARANNWHTDVTFVDRPPLGSVLRALEIPPYGGDTIWANSVTAYQDLPDHLRKLADELWAVHSNAYDYAEAAVNLSEEIRAYREIFTSTVYESLHPVVRVHPESGERGLFIGGFVRQIRGLSSTESDHIIGLLQSYVTRPENTVRWRWKVGDVAFWDNRATQHYAMADYGNQPRRVQRVTIVGDAPVSINGQKSQSVKGDASVYNKRIPVAV